MSDAAADADDGAADDAPGADGVYVDEEAEITRAPSRTSVGLSIAAGLLTALIVAPFSIGAAGAAALAVVVVAAGGVYGARWLFDVGGLILFVAVLAAGVNGARIAAVLAATVTAVLAWDVANYGAVLGRQLGRESPTRRIELVHATGSLAAGAVAVGVGYLLYAVGPSGLSVTVVAVLIVAAVLLVVALRS